MPKSPDEPAVRVCIEIQCLHSLPSFLPILIPKQRKTIYSPSPIEWPEIPSPPAASSCLVLKQDITTASTVMTSRFYQRESLPHRRWARRRLAEDLVDGDHILTSMASALLSSPWQSQSLSHSHTRNPHAVADNGLVFIEREDRLEGIENSKRVIFKATQIVASWEMMDWTRTTDGQDDKRHGSMHA
jgi:hypothetical protein